MPIKNSRFINSLVSIALLLFFSLLGTPHWGQADLPREGFPLGRPDLPEVRTVKELRPGLTHVHVERGMQGRVERPKFTFLSVQRDQAGRDQMRACLERAGYTVREKVETVPDSGLRYVLTAGEFDSIEELKLAAREIPCSVQIAELPGDNRPEGPVGPYVLDIVILDPKVYKGKVISSWSETVWRASPLELALKHNAVVAINGSWFEYSIDEIAGVPSGVSIVQGLWHHEPNTRARSIHIENHEDGGISLKISDQVPPIPELKWGEGKSTKLDGIDRMPKDNELVAMRESVFMESAYTHGKLPGHIALTLISEASTGVGYFIMATGDKRAILDNYKASGNPLKLDLSVPGRTGLNALYTAQPFIVDGHPVPQGHHDVTARTAMGADADGKIYLLVVHVDTPLWDSVGAGFSELTDVGLFLGLINFANLDGGPRSTSMVIEGKVVGAPNLKPYDETRRVADVVLVIDEENYR
ncbi:phosphodiester glycosidase family protein [Cephaloticoccus primus]|uniref:phosphodiester glycosidase family protein n=1 Tax=Cephaloticoccus primus TaxID=1548207 RepID=UPI0018D37702|nr:phosphodiester glycosidase family protein [Cephaloticoccus primus]